MGQKYVVTGVGNRVEEVFDEDNGNVPEGATPITEQEFNDLFIEERAFTDFTVSNGSLVLDPNHYDNRLDRVFDSYDKEVLRAALEVVRDEINNLRSYHSLPQVTLSQFRSAVKAKMELP